MRTTLLPSTHFHNQGAERVIKVRINSTVEQLTLNKAVPAVGHHFLADHVDSQAESWGHVEAAGLSQHLHTRQWGEVSIQQRPDCRFNLHTQCSTKYTVRVCLQKKDTNWNYFPCVLVAGNIINDWAIKKKDGNQQCRCSSISCHCVALIVNLFKLLPPVDGLLTKLRFSHLKVI